LTSSFIAFLEVYQILSICREAVVLTVTLFSILSWIGLMKSMIYRQKLDVYIRIFCDDSNKTLGYIINKSDYSDQVVDASGAAFVKALSRIPKTLDALCREIAENFMDTTPADIRQDAVEFYSLLEQNGFIVSGKTYEELEYKDPVFSSSLKPVSNKELKTDKTYLSSEIQRMDKKPQEFLDEHFKNRPLLKTLQVEITNKCNERCVHCYIPHENKITDIKMNLFYNVLEQCRNMGVLDIQLSGGEPLLHKNFCEFLYKAHESDLSVKILSNLTLLTDEIITDIKAVRVRDIQTSLYSLEAAFHDAITLLPGSCEKTKRGIIRLVEYGIPVSIVCPVMKQNKEHYSNVHKWAQSLGVHSSADVHIIARSDRTTDNLENRLNVEEAIQVISGIIKNSSDAYSSEYFSPDYQYYADSPPNVQDICKNTLCINTVGEVIPNPAWNNVLGNLNKQTLQDIWENSAEIKKLRNIGFKEFPQCRTCHDIRFCCMSLAGNSNENPEGNPFIIPEYKCKLALRTREINSTPMKCLAYRTPSEVFAKYGGVALAS
jgi:radical SAM protein with 4Fe4S-binding SPASM domain